jgi:hypothetical protein
MYYVRGRRPDANWILRQEFFLPDQLLPTNSRVEKFRDHCSTHLPEHASLLRMHPATFVIIVLYYLYISMYIFLSSFNVGVQHHVCHSVFFCSFTRVIFFSRLVAFAFCSCCATRLCKDLVPKLLFLMKTSYAPHKKMRAKYCNSKL